MPVDWVLGLLGGVMIGAAAAVYLLGNGRIMGASGIVAGLVDGTAHGRDRSERLVFVIALVLVPAIFVHAGAGPSFAPVVGLPVLALSGLLVGVGAQLANGCTSGHGVCGISRLAPRGIAATAVYIVCGAVGVAGSRWMGWA